MIISDLYQTRIDSLKYTLDHLEEVAITISLKDFNGANVTGKQVNNITCDKGVFIKITDKTRTNATLNNVKTVNASTNANGEITLIFKATDWGFCTISCNNMKLQILVDGWEEIIVGRENAGLDSIKLFVNGHQRLGLLKSINTNATFKTGLSTPSYSEIIPIEYCPDNQVVAQTVNAQGSIVLSSTGSVYYHAPEAITGNGNATMIWKY